MTYLHYSGGSKRKTVRSESSPHSKCSLSFSVFATCSLGVRSNMPNTVICAGKQDTGWASLMPLKKGEGRLIWWMQLSGNPFATQANVQTGRVSALQWSQDCPAWRAPSLWRNGFHLHSSSQMLKPKGSACCLWEMLEVTWALSCGAIHFLKKMIGYGNIVWIICTPYQKYYGEEMIKTARVWVPQRFSFMTQLIY